MTLACNTVLAVGLLAIAVGGCDSDPVDMYGAGGLGSGGRSATGGAGGGTQDGSSTGQPLQTGGMLGSGGRVGAGGILASGGTNGAGGMGGTPQDASIGPDTGLGLDAESWVCEIDGHCVNVGDVCYMPWYTYDYLPGYISCTCTVLSGSDQSTWICPR